MRRKRIILSLICWLVAAALPASAGVSVSFDVETLNAVLPALTAEEIAVPISESRSLGVRFENMQVTGLAPAADGVGSGHILTSVRVLVPQLGVSLPVEPRLSLHVVDQPSGSVLEMRFEQVKIALPLAGSLDIAPFLAPLRFPAENLWQVEGAEGDVGLRSRLSSIEMGQKVVRFDFDLETLSED